MHDEIDSTVHKADPDAPEAVALAAMKGAAMLMESGARAKVVTEFVPVAVHIMGGALGGFRLGFSSMSITVSKGGRVASTMINFREPGVNLRLANAVKDLALRGEKERMDAKSFSDELDQIKSKASLYSPVFVAVAVGFACAAFAMLLNGDAITFAAVLVASTVGQYLRHTVRHRGMNVYVTAVLVATVSSLIGGFLGKEAGSATPILAVVAPTLLLVPGIPATNAQSDIIDGFPILGSARTITVMMVMIFVTTGIWAADFILGITQ